MIILSLGSNLPSKYGDRFDNLKLAMSFLEELGIIIDKRSSFYETLSHPNKNNPKFINMVISIKTNLSPTELISKLIHVEEKFDRKRDKKNEPRTCDIDIIDYNSEILNLKFENLDLTIPHKEMRLRNFVLFPLQEILPNWKHPKTKEFIDTLIQRLSEFDRNSILKIKKN